jgi:hypothetical protein
MLRVPLLKGVCNVAVCRVFGELTVRRVAGRLHFAVHQQSFIDVLPQVRTTASSEDPTQSHGTAAQSNSCIPAVRAAM